MQSLWNCKSSDLRSSVARLAPDDLQSHFKFLHTELLAEVSSDKEQAAGKQLVLPLVALVFSLHSPNTQTRTHFSGLTH